MSEIIPITACLARLVTKTELKRLRQIVPAMLCMTGRVTMVGLSRWTNKGCGYRTIQRCSKVEWGALLWAVVEAHLTSVGGTYMLAVDEVVVSKAGKMTHGVGRFYSSIAGRPKRSPSARETVCRLAHLEPLHRATKALLPTDGQVHQLARDEQACSETAPECTLRALEAPALAELSGGMQAHRRGLSTLLRQTGSASPEVQEGEEVPLVHLPAVGLQAGGQHRQHRRSEVQVCQAS